MKLINDEWIDKEQCYEKHKKLVYRVCKNYRSNYFDRDDILQIGFEGLLRAYEAFDSSKGFRFSTYAVPKIRHELLKTFRDKGELIRRSRHAVALSYHLRKNDHSEESETFIMNYYNVDRRTVWGARSIIQGGYTSLHAKATNDENQELYELFGNEDDVSSIFVRDFIKSLNERQRKIIKLKLEDKSQREIGAEIGMSQVHVSRELHKIANKYREYEEVV